MYVYYRLNYEHKDIAGDNTDTMQGAHEQYQPASDKLPDVVLFLRKTETVIKQYLEKKESTVGTEELQSAIKDLAILLKNGDEDQSKYLLELMKKSNEEVVKIDILPFQK